MHNEWLINRICIFFSYKKELPELIGVGNKLLSKYIENKSNLHLQDQLNKCNKLIDVLKQENIQQKTKVLYTQLFIYKLTTNILVKQLSNYKVMYSWIQVKQYFYYNLTKLIIYFF